MEEKDIKENVEAVEAVETAENVDTVEAAEDVKAVEAVEATKDDAKPYQVVIEEERAQLFKSYATTRRVSNILMFVVVAAIVGIMFLIMSNIRALNIVGYSLAGAILLGMILFYLLSRKKMPTKTKNYMELVSSALRNRMFKDGYSELKYDPEERFQVGDVAGDGVYKDATSTNSRNIVHGVYKEHHFTYGELALLRPSTRKQQVPPLFVGRYITLPNNLKFDGRIIVTFKNPKQPLDLPNCIDDLAVLEEKDDMIVYGPEGTDFRKIIKADLISGLRKLKIENHLLNVNVAIWGGHTAAYISYDDAIMSFPFDKPFDYEAFEQSFKEFDLVMNLIAGE